jgi:hypothetical protein
MSAGKGGGGRRGGGGELGREVGGVDFGGGEEVLDAAAGDEGLGDVFGGDGDGAEGEAGDVEDGDGDEGLRGGELAAEPRRVGGEGGEGDEDGGGEGEGGVERARARRDAQLRRLARADRGEALGEGELPAKVLDQAQAREDLGHEPRALVGDEDRPPPDRADPAAQPRLDERGQEEQGEARERGRADAGPEDHQCGGEANGGGEEGLADADGVGEALGVVGEEVDGLPDVDAGVAQAEGLVVEHATDGGPHADSREYGDEPVLACCHRPDHVGYQEGSCEGDANPDWLRWRLEKLKHSLEQQRIRKRAAEEKNQFEAESLINVPPHEIPNCLFECRVTFLP